MDLMLNQWTATNKIFRPDSQIVSHYLGTFKSRIVIKLIVDFNCKKNLCFMGMKVEITQLSITKKFKYKYLKIRFNFGTIIIWLIVNIHNENLSFYFVRHSNKYWYVLLSTDFS